MKFTLFGKDIEISEGRKNYMKILNDYKELAAQAELEFKREYDDIFGLVILNDTWGAKFQKTYGSDNYMDNIVMKYVSKTRQYLTSYGVYDLSDSVIWENGIKDEEKSTSMLQYGLDDYVIECLALNEDDNSFITRLRSKFEGEFFQKCLHSDIMSLCDFVLDYLSDNNITEIEFVYKDDKEKAATYYTNLIDTVITEEDELKLLESIIGVEDSKVDEILQRGIQKANISASDKEQLAYELIALDPRNKTYHQYIFENYPNAMYEIAAIAKFLNIDLTDLIEKEIKRKFNLKAISNEDDALRMMSDLTTDMDKFGITQSVRKTELEKILNDYEIKARTYDGVVYNSRELCTQAKNDDITLSALYDINNIDKATCNEILSKIANMQCLSSIKDKHTSLLKDKIIIIDKDNLEHLLTGIDNMNELECNQTKEKINNYNTSEEIKAPFVSRVDKRIYEIWDEEDFKQFSEIYTQTPVGNFAQIEKNCKLIRDTGRTETKEFFVKALYSLNNSEVEVAAKYAVAKENGGLLSSIVSLGKKDAYEILTLNGRIMHPAILNMMEAVKAKKNSSIFSNFGFGKNKTPQPPSSSSNMNARFCSECGSPISDNSKFCSNCGNKLC